MGFEPVRLLPAEYREPVVHCAVEVEDDLPYQHHRRDRDHHRAEEEGAEAALARYLGVEYHREQQRQHDGKRNGDGGKRKSIGGRLLERGDVPYLDEIIEPYEFLIYGIVYKRVVDNHGERRQEKDEDAEQTRYYEKERVPPGPAHFFGLSVFDQLQLRAPSALQNELSLVVFYKKF